MKKRVVAFIDGFNVYHSVHELGASYNYLKWLNLNSLVRALIHPRDDELVAIEYFSADAHWNPVEKRRRQGDYLDALRSSGVTTHIGSFKQVKKKCSKCNRTYKTFEENGTDVAIASKMVEYAHKDFFDKALLFSADSDLAPVVANIRQSHPKIEIHIVTTSSRIRNAKHLRASANGYIQLGINNFEKNIFQETLSWGQKKILRPTEYDPPTFS